MRLEPLSPAPAEWSFGVSVARLIVMLRALQQIARTANRAGFVWAHLAPDVVNIAKQGGFTTPN